MNTITTKLTNQQCQAMECQAMETRKRLGTLASAKFAVCRDLSVNYSIMWPPSWHGLNTFRMMYLPPNKVSIQYLIVGVVEWRRPSGNQPPATSLVDICKPNPITNDCDSG